MPSSEARPRPRKYRGNGGRFQLRTRRIPWTLRRSGGTGRRAGTQNPVGLRPVWVQVPPSALAEKSATHFSRGVGVHRFARTDSRRGTLCLMRVGVLTGGGDCPGLNAVIRAVARRSFSRGRDPGCWGSVRLAWARSGPGFSNRLVRARFLGCFPAAGRFRDFGRIPTSSKAGSTVSWPTSRRRASTRWSRSAARTRSASARGSTRA